MLGRGVEVRRGEEGADWKTQAWPHHHTVPLMPRRAGDRQALPALGNFGVIRPVLLQTLNPKPC